jgi:hypothetical protein
MENTVGHPPLWDFIWRVSPAFKLQKPPQLRAPRPSRTLRERVRRRHTPGRVAERASESGLIILSNLFILNNLWAERVGFDFTRKPSFQQPYRGQRREGMGVEIQIWRHPAAITRDQWH